MPIIPVIKKRSSKDKVWCGLRDFSEPIPTDPTVCALCGKQSSCECHNHTCPCNKLTIDCDWLECICNVCLNYKINCSCHIPLESENCDE
jgi:hypothetical protein